MEPLDLTPMKRRKRRRWPWVVACFIPILGYAGYVGYQEYEVYHRPLLLTEVPKDVLVKQPEIAYAVKQYQFKGNEYIWGANDCSVFVMDYLKGCAKPVWMRLTTKELFNDATMAQLGFTEGDRKDPQPGDIIVYRYKKNNGQWRGHTGIVVKHEGRHWVVHNSINHDGVVVYGYNKFVFGADRITGRRSLVKFFRRNDFKSWEKTYAKREKALIEKKERKASG